MGARRQRGSSPDSNRGRTSVPLTDTLGSKLKNRDFSPLFSDRKSGQASDVRLDGATHCNTGVDGATHCNADVDGATHCNADVDGATHCNADVRSDVPASVVSLAANIFVNCRAVSSRRKIVI